MSGALCTLADLRTWRGHDDPTATSEVDAVIKRVILSTTEYIEKHCGRVLRRQEYIEYFDGNNMRQKYLSEPNRFVPIDLDETFELYKRTSMPVVEELIDETAYEIHDDGLIIYPSGFVCGKRNYKAVYTVGFDTTGWDTVGQGDSTGDDDYKVPDDLRKACAMQTALNLKKMNARYGDARLGLISKGIIETESISQYVRGIEPEVKELLAQYVKVQY